MDKERVWIGQRVKFPIKAESGKEIEVIGKVTEVVELTGVIKVETELWVSEQIVEPIWAKVKLTVDSKLHKKGSDAFLIFHPRKKSQRKYVLRFPDGTEEDGFHSNSFDIIDAGI